MSKSSFYEILEVSEKATEIEIRKAFKKKALICHPDKGGDPQTFAKLTEAYNTLIDPEKRKKYDQGFSPTIQIMKQIFKTQPKQSELIVTLEQAFKNEIINFEYTVNRACYCKSLATCSECSGTGITRRFMGFPFPCMSCGGNGKTIGSCEKCKEGIYQLTKRVQIKLTPAINYVYVFQNEGDQDYGREIGDLHVQLKFQEHSVFSIQQNNLVCSCELTFVNSLCGHTLTIEHPSGETIYKDCNDLVVSNGLQITIPHKGFDSDKGYGNLIIKYTVQTPAFLTDEQKDGIRKLFSK